MLKKEILAFKRPIKYFLINNLTKETCSTLSNMLALDYVTRLNSSVIIEEYANECIDKLKKFLGLKVITDSSFSTALLLFTVAVSPEQINYNDKNNILNHDKSQDTVIDILILIHFSDYSVQEQIKIKSILKSLFSKDSDIDIVNYINSEPKTIRAVISNALLLTVKQYEINNNVQFELNKIFKRTISLDNKISNFKQRASSITTGLITLAVAAVCVVTAGTALPLLIMPTTILSIKYAPKLGGTISQAILNLDNDIKIEKNYLQRIKSEITHKAPQILQQKQPSIPLDKTESLALSNIKTQKINIIKKQLKEYTQESKINNNIKLPLKKGKGRII